MHNLDDSFFVKHVHFLEAFFICTLIIYEREDTLIDFEKNPSSTHISTLHSSFIVVMYALVCFQKIKHCVFIPTSLAIIIIDESK